MSVVIYFKKETMILNFKDAPINRSKPGKTGYA